MEAETTAGSPASHWGTHDPADQTPRDFAAGLPRLVLECRQRGGQVCTPEAVVAELKARGLDVTLDDIREVWDRGC